MEETEKAYESLEILDELMQVIQHVDTKYQQI